MVPVRGVENLSPMSGVGHRRPRLCGRFRLALLQQLDRMQIGRAHKRHRSVALRLVELMRLCSCLNSTQGRRRARSNEISLEVADDRIGSQGEILRLSIALPSYPGERTFGPCRHSALRRSGNCPCRRHASPAQGPCNPHKFRQPDNLSAMVGVIDSISSGTALAENVGLCWPRWHLVIGSGRNAAIIA